MNETENKWIAYFVVIMEIVFNTIHGLNEKYE